MLGKTKEPLIVGGAITSSVPFGRSICVFGDLLYLRVDLQVLPLMRREPLEIMKLGWPKIKLCIFNNCDDNLSKGFSYLNLATLIVTNYKINLI